MGKEVDGVKVEELEVTQTRMRSWLPAAGETMDVVAAAEAHAAGVCAKWISACGWSGSAEEGCCGGCEGRLAAA